MNSLSTSVTVDVTTKSLHRLIEWFQLTDRACNLPHSCWSRGKICDVYNILIEESRISLIKEQSLNVWTGVQNLKYLTIFKTFKNVASLLNLYTASQKSLERMPKHYFSFFLLSLLSLSQKYSGVSVPEFRRWCSSWGQYRQCDTLHDWHTTDLAGAGHLSTTASQLRWNSA